MTVIPLPRPNAGVPLIVAVDRFLERFRDAPVTAETLAWLRAAAGDQLPAAALTPQLYAQTMARWDAAAAATFKQESRRAELVRRLLPPPGVAGRRSRTAPRAP
ncbi:hypothetical protein [Micromonospora rubida]